MWDLQKRPRYFDDWWLPSRGPGESFASFDAAALNAKEGEHPRFRREESFVWVYVDEATGHVHTADLKEAWRIKADVSPTGEQLYDVYDSKDEAEQHAAEGEVPESVLVPVPPGDEIVPRSGADISPQPAGEKEQIQAQIAELTARLTKLEQG